MTQPKPINLYDIAISNEFMDGRVFWARTVSSENESLFTQYTKHTFYEIQYALEGHIGMTINRSESLYVAESDFVVIPPDTYHQVVDADSRGARFIMAFSVSFKDEKMNGILHSLNTIFPYKETKIMRSILSAINEKSKKSGRVSKRIVSSLLESFLLEVFDTLRDTDTYKKLSEDEIYDTTRRVEAMFGFIKNSNGIGISVSDIAERFSMSERHVGRLFQNVLGKNPRDVINHEKLKKIEEYVISTELSFSEISELCGFSDEYAMNKFFKRYNLTNLSDFKRIAKKQTAEK